MADTISSLEGLGSLGGVSEAPRYEQKLDKEGRAYATGKRKDAVARVWIKPGGGRIVINEKPVEQYFARPVLRMILAQPLQIARPEAQVGHVLAKTAPVGGGDDAALGRDEGELSGDEERVAEQQEQRHDQGGGGVHARCPSLSSSVPSSTRSWPRSSSRCWHRRGWSMRAGARWACSSSRTSSRSSWARSATPRRTGASAAGTGSTPRSRRAEPAG